MRKGNEPCTTVPSDLQKSDEAASRSFASERTRCDIEHYGGILRMACMDVEEWIPEKSLGKWIDRGSILDRQVSALKKADKGFKETVVALRNVLLIHDYDSEGQAHIQAQLRPVLEILGFACPKEGEGLTHYKEFHNLCVSVGIEVEEELLCMTMPGGKRELFVLARDVLFFIKAAGLPSEIEARLSKWYLAFLDEKEASAPWCAPPGCDIFVDIDEE